MKESKPKDKETQCRPIYEIATEIRRDWGSKVNYGAKPYLAAMVGITDINEPPSPLYHDGARDTIARFLCNAGSWRGETARRVKAELKAMLK